MASHCPRWWRLTSRRSRHPNRQRRCRRFSASSAEFSRRGIPRTTRSTWPKSTYESPRRCERRAGRSTRPPASLRGERHGMVRHRKRRSGRPAFGHAVTTIHYLVCKNAGAAKARQTLTAILLVFGVAMVDERVILKALEMQSPDFEDSVTAAELAECDLIVTRDPRGFRGSPVQALAPEAAAPLLA